jgi:hypothetical protein
MDGDTRIRHGKVEEYWDPPGEWRVHAGRVDEPIAEPPIDPDDVRQ